MKISAYFLISIFSVIYFAPLNSQVSKGDYLFSISNSLNYSDVSKIPTLSINATYVPMLTNKIMVGGSIGYSRSFTGSFSTIVETTYHQYNQFNISPIARYYFYNKQFSYFASLENSFRKRKYKEDSYQGDFSGFRTIAGLGANYFLGNNIAIESSINSNILNLGDYKGDNKYVSFNLGLRLFYNSKFSKNIDQLSSHVLRKGNITSSARISFLRTFNEGKTGNLRITPNIRYFLTDRLNIFSSLSYSRFKFHSNSQILKLIGIGGEYYFKFNQSVFLSFSVSGAISHSTLSYNGETLPAFRNVNIPIHSTFHYFTKQKKWFAGIGYQFYEHKRMSINSYSNRKTIEVFGGMEYYIFENVYFKGQLKWTRLNIDNIHTIEKMQSSARFSLGMGFLIDGRRIR